MSHGRKKHLQVAAGLAVVVFMSKSVIAQEIRPLAITDWQGQIAYELLYQTELTEGGSRTRESDELTMQGTVGFFTKGYVYHPNLLDFDIGFDLGLTHEEESGEFDDSRTDTLTAYDVHLAIEKTQPYGVDFFALKDQEIVSQRFTRNSIIDVDQYRLVWDTDNEVLPTLVELSSRTNEQKGAIDRTEVDNRALITSSNRLGDFSTTNFRYLFRDFTQEEFDYNLKSHDFNISNSLLWGNERRKSLNSSFTYRTEENGVQNDRWTATTLLNWEHTKNLESSYSIRASDSSLSSDDAPAIDTFTHSEEVRLRHQLYENLTSVVFVDNSDIDSSTFDEQRYGGGVDFAYTRPIPTGSVNAGVGYSLRRTDQRTSGGLSPVIDEPHILQVGFPVFLNNTNVDLTSVFITDVFGTPLTEGLDYELQVVGVQVRVVRLRDPVPPIVGEAILVDYLFFLGGDLVYDTATFQASAGVNLFNRLSIQYRFADQSQDLRDGDPEQNTLQDVTDHRADIRYFVSDPAGLRYQVSAFYHNRDSTFSPFESYGFGGEIGRSIGRRNDLQLSASYSDTDFSDTGDKTEVKTFTGTWTTTIRPGSFVILDAGYRDVGGTIDDRTGLELRLRFETFFRLVRLSLELSHEREESAAQDIEVNLVYFRISRTF